MKEAGSNSFVLSPLEWITTVNAKELIVKAGNTGGTYAHKNIAFEFAAWISAEFKLYLIKEFQRLKESESSSNKLEWNIHRTISKINNSIHTDAIRETLIPPTVKSEAGSYCICIRSRSNQSGSLWSDRQRMETGKTT